MDVINLIKEGVYDENRTGNDGFDTFYSRKG